MLLFDLPMRGSWLLLCGAIALFLIGAQAQGLLISTIAETQQVAFQVALLSSFLPTMILSGFIFPISSMPTVVQVDHAHRPGALLPRRAARDRAEGRGHRGVLAGHGGARRSSRPSCSALASLRLGRAVDVRADEARPSSDAEGAARARQDPRLFGIVILAPIIQLNVLGYAATTDVKDMPIAIVDADRSTAEPRAGPPVRSVRQFQDRRRCQARPSEIDPYLDRGEAWMALSIPPDYGRKVARRPADDDPGRRRRHRLELDRRGDGIRAER